VVEVEVCDTGALEISVIKGNDQRLWKWTAFLDGRLLSGQASSKPRALARAEQIIDQAVAPKQLIIQERAAGLLREVHVLPPGPERDSIVKDVEQFVGSFAALKAKAK
jgi:hypothetical protein